MPYAGKFRGPFPVKAFALASVIVTEPAERNRCNPVWQWAVLSAAEKLTGWAYAMTFSGEVRSMAVPRTTPIPKPEPT
jgi:hypothetical protein